MRYLVADTETTGIKDPHIVEIGWIEVDETLTEVDRVESLIDPEHPISFTASGVHGLEAHHVADSPTIGEFFSDPACYGQKIAGPIYLIGHRVSFDSPLITPWVDGEVVEVDTLRWARHLYPDLEDHKLSTLMYALDLPRAASHRVMADVETALALLIRICTDTSMTLPQLCERSRSPMLLHRMFMGKHRGELFSDVPKSYLRWMVENLEGLDMDATFTIETCLKAR